MRTARRRKSKNLYVVKQQDTPLQAVEAKKKSETKNVYVLRTSEETVNKYADIVYEFVDEVGLFVLVTSDRNFYHAFKSAVVFDLGIEMEFVRLCHDTQRAAGIIQNFTEKGLQPMVFLDRTINHETSLPFLRFLKATYPKTKVVVMSREVDRDHLYQFHEDGASSFLQKPPSANTILKKIAYVLKPQTEIDALLEEGRTHIADRRYDEALEVAQSVILRWPNTSAAHVIKGDALKGLAQRRQAYEAYLNAEKNAKNYLEPYQKLAMFHIEENNMDGALNYLTKLDKMSPLNSQRKLKIAQIHIERGTIEDAQQFLDTAISSAKREAMSVVGEMALDVADMVYEHDPEMAARYYRESLGYIKEAGGQMAMGVYNRLGISLRRQGMWQEAVEAYAEAHKYSPRDENIMYNMALAYLEGSQIPSAATSVGRALKLNPTMHHESPDIALNMADIFNKAGHSDEAIKCCEVAITAHPGHPEAQIMLEQLSGGG